MRRTARLERGFTMVEMLVVIAVIGLLAVVIIASLHPLEQLKKSRDARRYADAKQLYGAYQNYYSTYSEYPWDNSQVTDTTLPSSAVAVNPEFELNTQDSYFLVDRGELKQVLYSKNPL
jgi:prepilin-type N-terminal cleavage/methylation domain-containing protein